jgi:hypothetical protein
VCSADDLARLADELNRRPRKMLGGHSPKMVFTTLGTSSRSDDRRNPPIEDGEFENRLQITGFAAKMFFGGGDVAVVDATHAPTGELRSSLL